MTRDSLSKYETMHIQLALIHDTIKKIFFNKTAAQQSFSSHNANWSPTREVLVAFCPPYTIFALVCLI